jgi:magnesium transporter
MNRQLADSAALFLTSAVVRARPDECAGEVRSRLGEHELDDTEQVYVLDGEGRLLGLLAFADLFRMPNDATVRKGMRGAPPVVQIDEDQEKVASIALHYDLTSVPVLDIDQRLLGVVPARALLKIMRREHVEDIHRLAGIRRETAEARRALDAPPLRRVRDRLPWLVLGLGGSALATFVMSRFETALSTHLALAFFVPALVYLADAIGTQTEAVAVRGLSLAHIGIAPLLGGELRTGLIIGLVLGGMTFPSVWFVFDDIRLAFAVAGTLLVAGGLASTVGMILPWLLTKMNRDPAFGSGPLATVIQDVLTLLTYFIFVSMLY